MRKVGEGMREIGGEFHLPISYLFKKRLNQFNRFIPNSASFLTSSGRDSLSLIIKLLGLTPDDEVLLPSYLCPDILRPFREAGIATSFYRINRNLSIDFDDIERRITKKTKALLVIHYFGYPQPIKEIRRLADKHSLWWIEDSVQSFLSKYDAQPLGWFGDIGFTSYRKFLPILDGSLVLINNKELGDSPEWETNSLNYWLYLCLRYWGMRLKSLYLKTYLAPKPLFLWFFDQAERTLNRRPKPARMSALSKRLLNRFDFDDIISRRRRNFQYLLNNWPSKTIQPLFQKLPADVCPLGFPVFANNRDYVKQQSIRRRIYPPIHWELPEEVDKDEFAVSWEISRHILTIPIDQRYGLDEMNYIIRQVKEIEVENDNVMG